MTNWQEFPNEFPDMWDKMCKHFDAVHIAHTQRVQRNLNLMSAYFEKRNNLDLAMQTIQRGIQHDQSKLHNPEYEPYVWRVYRTKWNKEGRTESVLDLYYRTSHLDQVIRDAVFHHITHNRHHPEWHPDPDDMAYIDVVEMVCDWHAMSQEFQSDTHEWAKYVVPRRYAFGNHLQSVVFDTVKLIKELDSADNTQRT